MTSSVKENVFATRWPPGHFYSPLPSIDFIQTHRTRLFPSPPRTLPGIELNETSQLDLMTDLTALLPQCPIYGATRQPPFRFHHVNRFYEQRDALLLFCMMLYLKPSRIVEIGSGFSSLMMLDTNEHCLDGTVSFDFIEPFPERLLQNLSPQDMARTQIHKMPLQDIPLDIFRTLKAHDILFVDSSHVAKIGSDVNKLVFEILPMLPPGVLIHFHDICYPFEYPERWLLEGRAWNEAYLLRAFLQYNQSFDIRLFASFLSTFHAPVFEQPAWLKHLHGGTGSNLWLEKTQ